MTKITLPLFGELDEQDIEKHYDGSKYYECETIINGKEITLDINFKSSLNLGWSERFEKMAPNIEALDTKFYELINKYANEKEASDDHSQTVIDFISFHKEDLEKEMLSSILEQAPDKKNIASAIKLGRIGFYTKEPNTAIWDYYFVDLSDDLRLSISDQLLVIKTDMQGEVIDFSWES